MHSIFQLYHTYHSHYISTLKSILESSIIKIGIGLKSDRKLLLKKYDIKLSHTLDLNKIFNHFGHNTDIGLKNAIALTLNQHFHKSSHQSKSNWANKHLTPKQISYAANDAYGALLVFYHLPYIPIENLKSLSQNHYYQRFSH
jgi:ribonuclease D